MSVSNNDLEPQEFSISDYEIRLPKQTKWEPQNALALMQRIYDLVEESEYGLAQLRIVARESGISWQVEISQAPSIVEPALTNTIASLYPGAVIHETPYIEKPYPFYRRSLVLQRQYQLTYFDPFVTVFQMKSFDPAKLVVQAMSQLLPDEELTLDIIIGGVYQMNDEQISPLLFMSEYDAGVRYVNQQTIHYPRKWSSDTGALAGQIIGSAMGTVAREGFRWFRNQGLKKKFVPKFAEQDMEFYHAKLSQKLAQIGIGLSFDTPNEERLSLLSTVAKQVINVATDSPVSITDGMDETQHIKNDDDYFAHNPFMMFGLWAEQYQQYVDQHQEAPQPPYYDFHLTALEAASLWHLPHQGYLDLVNTQIAWHEPAAEAVNFSDPAKQIPFGVIGEKDVALSRTDRRLHTYLSGKTGMGKSTLLHTLIHDHIFNGDGVGVVDPHGTLVDKILRESIPEDRLDDVVYLKVDDPDYPVPLNPLRVPEGVEQSIVFSSLLWIFQSIYADSWSTSRMETAYRNILELLLHDPEATPLDIQELVNNRDYRANLLKKVSAGSTRLPRTTQSYWRDFENLTASELRERTAPILHRLSAFLGTGHLELLTCHSKTINYQAMIEEKKIVLIDLSGGRIINEVGNLGAIVLANFFLYSMTLGAIDDDANEPPRYHLFVDDARRIISNPLKDMFSESRKFGLAITLASQFIGQFDSATRDEINKNVGTKISFKSDDEDAQRIAKFYQPDVTPTEIVAFDVGQAVVRTTVDGKSTPPFLVQTYQPLSQREHPETVSVKRVKAASRKNLGLITADEVEASIDARYEGEMYAKPPAATGMTRFDQSEASDD